MARLRQKYREAELANGRGASESDRVEGLRSWATRTTSRPSQSFPCRRRAVEVKQINYNRRVVVVVRIYSAEGKSGGPWRRRGRVGGAWQGNKTEETRVPTAMRPHRYFVPSFGVRIHGASVRVSITDMVVMGRTQRPFYQ